MRIRHLVALAVLAAVAASFMGCDLFGISISRRLELFGDSLNSADRSGVTAANFSQSQTVNYASADATFWNTVLPPLTSPERYFFMNIVSTDPNNVTADMVGPASWGASRPAVFKMVVEGMNDNRIKEFYLNGSVVLQ